MDQPQFPRITSHVVLQIIPQAVCSRYGLSIGAKLSIVVRFIVIVLFPLSYPISKVRARCFSAFFFFFLVEHVIKDF
jgi:CBS domain containing-hemolysin-like protein